MASTLAPQPLLRQRLGFCCRARALSLYQQAIRHSHHDRGGSPAGLTANEKPAYRKFPWHQIRNREICLWNGGQRLGVMTLQKAMTDFLGQGKTLSWRAADEVLRRLDNESCSKDGVKVETSTHAGDMGDTDILHYDITSIAGSKSKLTTAIRRTVEERGGHRVFFRSNSQIAMGSGNHQLSLAYRILADPRMAARYPVQIHITSPKEQKTRTPYYGVEWAVHNRADLRPEVIRRAMPPGAQHTGFFEMKEDGTDAFFTVTAKNYNPRISDPPKDKVQPDPPGKANRTQASAGTRIQPSPELQMKFERALQRALQKAKEAIHRESQRSLKRAVKLRVRKLNGGPTTPLPEEISKVQERKRAAIERALPKVRANVARGFGINIEPTGVVEDDTVDGSEGVPSPPTNSSRSS